MTEQNITAQVQAELKQSSEVYSSGMQNGVGLESEPSVIATADMLLEKARLQYSNHQKTVDPATLMSQLDEGALGEAPDVVSSPEHMQSSPKITNRASHSTNVNKQKRLYLQQSAGVSKSHLIESEKSARNEDVMSGPLPLQGDGAAIRMNSDSPDQNHLVQNQAFNSVPRRSGKFARADAAQDEVDEELILLAAAMNGQPLPDNGHDGQMQNKMRHDAQKLKQNRGNGMQEARGSIVNDNAPTAGKHQRIRQKANGGRRRSQGHSISSGMQVGMSSTKEAMHQHQKVITQNALVYLRGNSHHAYAPQSSSLNGIRSVGGGLHVSGPAASLANGRKKKVKQRNNLGGGKESADHQLMLPPIPLVASQASTAANVPTNGLRKKSPPISTTSQSQKMSSINAARQTYDSVTTGASKAGSLKPMLSGTSRASDKLDNKQLSKSQSIIQGENPDAKLTRKPEHLSPLKHQNSEVLRQKGIAGQSPRVSMSNAASSANQAARRRMGQGQSMNRARPSGGPLMGFNGQVLPAPGASPVQINDCETDENSRPEDRMVRAKKATLNSANRHESDKVQIGVNDSTFISLGNSGVQPGEKAGQRAAVMRESNASGSKHAPFISNSNEASGGKLKQPRRSRSPLSQRNLNMQDALIDGQVDDIHEDQKQKVNYEQKNLQRLEALKAKKAAEIQQMEAEREKTKRRQEKLANKILREAEANRRRKAEQAEKEDQDQPQEAEQQNMRARRKSLSPNGMGQGEKENEEDDAEQQKKLAMMRKFYRNRHATFIKTLLQKKKGEKDLEEERKRQEAKLKQKVKEKALAKLQPTNDDLDTGITSQNAEMSALRLHRGSSMSARQGQYKALQAIGDSNSVVTTNQSSGGAKNTVDPPSSKEQKQRQMCKAYGMGIDKLATQEKKRGRLVRVNSRGSVRSQKSTQSATPVINRSSALVKIGQGLEDLAMEPPEIFDEEREQKELEEARKRKERAKKMRAQQEKMLAEIQAKKEAAEKEEEEKRRKYEKKLAKAREQAKAIADAIPEKPPASVEEAVVEKKKPPRQPMTDKNCLQAPDNEADSPVKKEKKPFIEPDLKAFLERNMPNLKVFANITDMKTWKKKHQVEDDAKVFIVTGGYGFLKKSLRKRGWVENKDPNSPCFDLKWTLKSKDINHNTLQDTQLVNHFPKASAITTKVGLMHNLKNLIWFNNIDIETFYPRCYDLALQEEQDDFAQEYMAVKAECHLKRFVRELRESAQAAADAANQEGEDGNEEEQKEIEIKTSVKEKVVKLAIKVCERRLKDLNEMIDDPKAFTHLVSPEEWKILGADELNEKKLQKQKHEKRLQSLNMPLPPRSKKKKKRKRLQKDPSQTKVTTPGYEQQDQAESSEDEVEVEDEDEAAALDKAIAKKFPDFKQAVQIIEDLKKMYPQTGLNGEKNIWIIKPAQSSRGRGIVLMKNLVQIMEVCKQQEFQFIAQKYIENPLIVKNRKFDLRVWVLVTDWNPLTIWLFKKPYVRLPAHDYDPQDIDNNFAHLANNSIAKYGDKRQNMYEIDGNMMFVEELQEYLLNLHCSDIYEDVIEEKIRQVVINTLESVQDTFEYKRGCFELYGFDIMVDDEFNCWLIEVNSSPAMDYSTHVTEKLVKQCLEDTVKVIVDYEVPRTAKKKAQVDTGEYELIYKASRVVEKPLNTFGLNLDVVGKKIPDKHLSKY